MPDQSDDTTSSSSEISLGCLASLLVGRRHNFKNANSFANKFKSHAKEYFEV